MSAERVFKVDIEFGASAWKVWISEELYRGAISDSDLPGERQEIGGGYSSRHLVARGLSKRKAIRVGRKALKQAQRRAEWRVRNGQQRLAYRDANPDIHITTTTERNHP